MNERNSQTHNEGRPGSAHVLGPRDGSRDGQGWADHDQPFAGYKPYHFSTRQMLHLLRLRSEMLDARLGLGRFATDLAAG